MSGYSTLSRKDYIEFSLIFGFFAVGLQYFWAEWQSQLNQLGWYLILTFGVSFLACLFFTLGTARHFRNFEGELLNALASGGVFALMFHRTYDLDLTKYLTWALIGLSFIVVLNMVILRIISGKGFKRIFFEKLTVVLRIVVSLVALVSMIALPLATSSKLKAQNELITVRLASRAATMVNVEAPQEYLDAPRPMYGSEYSFPNHVQDIMIIAYEEAWNSSSEEERTTAITALTECELHRLGVMYHYEIEYVEDLKDEVYGHFDHLERRIRINKNRLLDSSAREMAETALHEARHAYQYSLCTLYSALPPREKSLFLPLHVDEWLTNFENYVDDDYEEYYAQSIERDAREYSDYRIFEYYDAIKAIFGDDPTFND